VGEGSDKIYDDLEGVSKVTAFPDEAPHRKTDKMTLSAGAEQADRIKTAIVCPPTIYGIGRGPDNKRSHQIPELARATLQKGQGIQVGDGKAFWSNVHVHDLSDLYLKLVENAASGESLAEWPGKPALWGSEAYYFSENGEHVWGEAGGWIAAEAKKQGYISRDEVKSVTADEAGEMTMYGQAIWGMNSRSRAKRARAVLGWKPAAPSLKDEIKAAVEFEARKLGVEPGHAKVAAGNA
jgi:nucleoside-diphosphate-sugar epimerase